MRKTWARFLSAILTVCMILTVLPMSIMASAEQGVIMSVSDAEGKNGDTVEISVSVSVGSNANGGNLTLVYDTSKLELISATAGKQLATYSPFVNDAFAAGKVRMTFAGVTPLTSAVTLLNLSFKVISNTPGDTDITLENAKLYDENAVVISKSISNGSVTILSSQAQPELSISSANGKSGDTVSVDVTITENGQICGGNFNLVYDNTKLEVIGASAGSVVSSYSPMVNTSYASNKIRMTFAGITPITEQGKICTVVFRIKDGVTGDAVLSLENSRLYDENSNALRHKSTGAVIKIQTETTVESERISISSANGNSGETVQVSVSISGDASVFGGNFTLNYDKNKLTLVSAQKGETLASHTVFINTSYSENQARMTFAGASALSPNTVLCTFSFKIKDSATGNADLSFDAYKLYDGDSNAIAAEADFGNVTIASSTLIGDVNSDGQITSKDVTILRRYLAGGWGVTINELASDINSDGSVTTKDVTLLRRYLAGGWGVELGTETPSADSLTVQFDKRNGESVIVQNVTKGNTVTPPAEPTKDGYVFCGWHTSPYAEAWIDSIDLTVYQITEDTTFYAVWGSEDFDVDGDGLSHKGEATYSTDPYVYDSDEDGLSDGEEVLQYHTNPLLADTDGDGLLDGVEVELGLNPLNPVSDGITNDADKEIEYAFSDQNYSLSVQAEANVVSSISVSALDKKALDDSDGIISPILDITKRSQDSFNTAELVYYYGDDDLGDIDEDDLAVFYLNEETETFEEVPSVTDKDSKTITASLSHFSFYAVGDVLASNSRFTLQSVIINYCGRNVSAKQVAHCGFDLLKDSFAFHNFDDFYSGYCHGFSMVAYLNYIGKLPVAREAYTYHSINGGDAELKGYDLSNSIRFSDQHLYREEESNVFNRDNDCDLQRANFEGISDPAELEETLTCIQYWFGKQHEFLDTFYGPLVTDSLINATLQAKLLSGEPVMIRLSALGLGAHSVLAYGYYQTDNEDYILVYDCNLPGKTCYIKLNKMFSFYTGAIYEEYNGIENAPIYKIAKMAIITIPDGPYVQQNEAGTLSGKICKASDHVTAIPGATIKVYRNDTLYAYKIADDNGNYSINLPSGQYYVEIFAEGYIVFRSYATVTANTTTYMETFLMIEGSENTVGEASGTVFDALMGTGVDGISLLVRRDWNNENDSAEIVASAVTDEYGNYSLSLPLGNYTVIATKSGYLPSMFNIVVQEDVTANQNGTITPLVSGNDYYITLRWNENPRDLDSHVEGKLTNGNSFHVYYSHKSQYDGDIEICNLDYDDVDSYGPENITLRATLSDPYYYYIYRYAGSGTVAASGASIEVHQGNLLIAKFNVPTNLGDGDYWNVFAIKDGQIIVKNTITSFADTSYAN